RQPRAGISNAYVGRRGGQSGVGVSSRAAQCEARQQPRLEGQLRALDARIAAILELVDTSVVDGELYLGPFDVIDIDVDLQAVIEQTALGSELVVPQGVGG